MVASAIRFAIAPIVALALGCGGGPSPSVTASPTPAPTDAFYAASARAYGFDFDGRVWEVERLPQCSLVRRCIHPDVMPRSFFTTGCEGELTRLRGFAYCWQLQSGAVPCRLDPSQQDREFLLAFTHEPSVDELPREMLRAWLGPGAFQWSSEAAASIELARRLLGRWPDSSR